MTSSVASSGRTAVAVFLVLSFAVSCKRPEAVEGSKAPPAPAEAAATTLSAAAPAPAAKAPAPALSPSVSPSVPPAAAPSPATPVPATAPVASTAAQAVPLAIPVAVPASIPAAVSSASDPRVAITLATGKVVIDLFEGDCPAHAENFKRLVTSGYFNGTTFHRVCAGFAQAGDPTGTGTGGRELSIPAEIKRPHLRGSLVAARIDNEPNSTKESHGSQFLIMKVKHAEFDGKYTVFGQVVEGMDLVDKILTGDREKGGLIDAGSGDKILRAEILPGAGR